MRPGLKALLGAVVPALLVTMQPAFAQELTYQRNDPGFAGINVKKASQPPQAMYKMMGKPFVTTIETCIGVNGRSYNTKVAVSSGDEKFDKAVRAWAAGWVWHPPQRCGVPVAICGYTFDLQLTGASSQRREYKPDPVILPPCGSPIS